MPNSSTRHALADTPLAADVRAWRRAHPEATLTEIEQVLDDRLNAARAALLAEVAADAPDEEARCPRCGGRRAAGVDPILSELPGLRRRGFPPSMSAWVCGRAVR